MTAAGWILMITVIVTFTSVVLYCSWKVASMPPSAEHVRTHIELDTPDMHRTE
ncbi:MAG: hypothetical protein LBH00_02290 [Planctomycetaceae bacterium]|nr:hypothetical protein [Planctomycetaceae bacterium]